CWRPWRTTRQWRSSTTGSRVSPAAWWSRRASTAVISPASAGCDKTSACSTPRGSCPRSSFRNQDFAPIGFSPSRLRIIALRLERESCSGLPREHVGALVQRIAGMSGDLDPLDRVHLVQADELLPQVAVADRCLRLRHPAVADPVVVPALPEAVHQVRTV